jgi:murein DD-endopeptidase MepM/ murein hydrolase activator NlpD
MKQTSVISKRLTALGKCVIISLLACLADQYSFSKFLKVEGRYLLKRETYTVVVMPSSGRRMRTFSISMSRLILILISFAVVVTASLTIGSLATWRFYERQKQVAAEAVQNHEALQKEVREIRKSYSDLANILGIEIVETNDELGKGGPEMPELTDVSISEPSSADEITDNAGMDSVLMEAASLKTDFEDLARIANAKIAELAMTPSIWPVKLEPETQMWISSRFGTRRSPFTKAWERHEAMDISSRHGTPIVATADGTIADMGKDRYLGNFVEVRHNEKFSTLYGHMNRFAKDMKKRTKVERGQVIGYMGRTGRTTGTHVHYEVRVYDKPVNPANYILN